MHTLSIEHRIVDFATWKAAFDRDPAGRQRSGVRRYRVFRPSSDPKYVIVELDFASAPEAAAFLVSLERVWGRAELSPGLLREPVSKPQSRILEAVAMHDYDGAHPAD